jgi:chorismate mutase
MQFSPDAMPARTSSHDGEETLTVLDAARRAGVTQSAIVRWIRNGYLSATPSSQGWMIPAHMLASAAHAADEARGTAPVPRQTGPSLAPAPTPIRRTLERRAPSTTLGDASEHIVTPLAELIRDQIDVVHDQAEVIGWLQAERARLADEVAKLRAERFSNDRNEQTAEEIVDLTNESELYDEVLSLFWKEADTPAEPDSSDQATHASPFDPFKMEQPEQVTEPPDVVPFDREPEPEPKLKVEEYTDPSWFFTSGKQEQPRARLQPIVARDIPPAESDDDNTLDQMIDETERKIADLWRTQEELRTAPRVVIEPDTIENSSRGTMWQRLWPLRR